MTALFWTAVIIGAALFAAVVIRELRDWETPPKDTHTPECEAWSTLGTTDPHCTMPHPPHHFATPRDQVDFENTFDGQIGFTK